MENNKAYRFLCLNLDAAGVQFARSQLNCTNLESHLLPNVICRELTDEVTLHREDDRQGP